MFPPTLRRRYETFRVRFWLLRQHRHVIAGLKMYIIQQAFD